VALSLVRSSSTSTCRTPEASSAAVPAIWASPPTTEPGAGERRRSVGAAASRRRTCERHGSCVPSAATAEYQSVVRPGRSTTTCAVSPSTPVSSTVCAPVVYQRTAVTGAPSSTARARRVAVVVPALHPAPLGAGSSDSVVTGATTAACVSSSAMVDRLPAQSSAKA
jgi:hypothetical protein